MPARGDPDGEWLGERREGKRIKEKSVIARSGGHGRWEKGEAIPPRRGDLPLHRLRHWRQDKFFPRTHDNDGYGLDKKEQIRAILSAGKSEAKSNKSAFFSQPRPRRGRLGPASPRLTPALFPRAYLVITGPPPRPRHRVLAPPASLALRQPPLCRPRVTPTKKTRFFPFSLLLFFPSPITAPSGSPRAGISAPNPGLISKSLSGYHGPFSAPSAPRPGFANEPCSPATTLMPAQGDLDKKDPLFPFPSSLFLSFFSPSPGPGLKGAPPSQPTIIQQKTAPPPSGSGAASFIQAITLRHFQPPPPLTAATATASQTRRGPASPTGVYANTPKRRAPSATPYAESWRSRPRALV